MSTRKVKALVPAIREAYARGEEDEALEPIVLADEKNEPVGRFKTGDYVIFYDIRGEREVELTESFTEENFSHFGTEAGLKVNFVTMIEYDKKLKVKVAFPPEGEIKDTLSETISKNNLRQLKIAESEKAIHVAYFFNGKVKNPLPGEERITVPSPELHAYDQRPEMSIVPLSKAVIRNLKDERVQFLLANFCNIDVIGHIENERAAMTAVETVDRHLGEVAEAARTAGITMVITADHGTVEKWLYPDGVVDTGHTDSPVPFILLDHDNPGLKLREGGELQDVAPTILELLGLKKPEVMTGESLLARGDGKRRRVLLLILDGWGAGKPGKGNLIARADTPVMDSLKAKFPYTELRAAGEAVGMPEGTVGNSEAGHLHLGAGRRILADRVKIDRAVKDGTFFENEAFLWAIEGARKNNTALHLLGIVSFYSSHGSIKHLFALMDLAKKKGLKEVYIHSMLGRRGESPESGAKYINMVVEETKRSGLGRVVSVIGRFWSLDREEHWDRIEKTYRMLVYG